MVILAKKKKKGSSKYFADRVLNYLNDKSIKMFGIPYNALEPNQEQRLMEYISDIEHPKWKVLKIHEDGTSCNVSNTGKVEDMNGKSLKAYVSGAGYQTVWIRSISNPKVCYPRFIHRLVAEAFIPNPDNKLEVNHIDTDKFNCWHGNLEWVTHEENIRHSIDLGHQVVGMDHANAKWTDDQIREVCKMLENPDVVLQDIVKKTGVSIKTITHIRFHNGWHHIAKDYKIAVPRRNPGPRYSPLSIKIRDLIIDGKDNDEIKAELDKTGLSSDVSDKSISDRIWYIRTKLI